MAKNLKAGRSDNDRKRCWWCGSDPIYVRYHDTEWGVPLRDDRRLFEMLILEGFQAGLSWIMVLKKRENFRRAFKNFDPVKIAKFTKGDITRLMNDAGIVRNRLKITAAITNARCFLEVKEEFGSFGKYIWQFTGGKTLRTKRELKQGKLPATTKESDAMSKDLKARGFKFVGSTVCYAHMQATGMVDDHVKGCFKYKRR